MPGLEAGFAGIFSSGVSFWSNDKTTVVLFGSTLRKIFYILQRTFRMVTKISERVKGIKYAIRDIEVGAPEGVLKLNIGDPLLFDFKLPKVMEKAMIKAIRAGHNYYAESQGLLVLREAIAQKEGISPENVIVTAGTSEAVNFLFAALAEGGSEVLIPSPTYPQYSSMIKLWGGKPVFYSCDSSWFPEISDIKKKITKRTKGLVLINPNNPTGAVYPKDILAEIASLCEEREIPIISDEIYYDLTFGKPKRSISKIANGEAIVLNGMSKCYLAPGWRVGWLTLHNFKDTQLRESILKLCRLRLCINTPAQYAMAEVMKGKNNVHIEQMEEKLRERRDFIMRRFGEIGLKCARPDGAFYAFPCVEDKERRWKSDIDFVLKLRDKEKLLVVHGGGFEFKSKPTEKYFRIVFLPPIKILDEALNRIERFVKH